MATWVQFPAYRPTQNRLRRQTSQLPKLIMQPVCKHPKVRVVAREDDVEYVECEECGEVFDADEYQEMTLDTGGDEMLAEDDA